jgi:parallel beta-helix repeat protein
MEGAMTAVASLRQAWRAGTASDRGLERTTNEDRVYVDESRGIFLVVDGVGGQAAGDKAAETAVEVIERELAKLEDPPEPCIRRAVTAANNEIYRLAGSNSEWHGMACVLTLAVVSNRRLTTGHVGDSRLYLAWDRNLRKVTSDHSPVGEREDLGELTEAEAMSHPGRNQVYRQVGSSPHDAWDEDFIEIRSLPFRNDAALLLCSDGLSDAVPSAEISSIVETYDGDPEAVAIELVNAANRAGGRDNISVVFVPGPEFTGSNSHAMRHARARHGTTRVRARRWRRVAGRIAWLVVGAALGFAVAAEFWPKPVAAPVVPRASAHVIADSDPLAISRALKDAHSGDTIEVPPGEFAGPLVLVSGVNLISQKPGGAIIHTNPAAPADAGIAVIARNIAAARISGFRITGSSEAPLATGVLIENALIEVDDMEIAGAADAGVRISGSRQARLAANRIHSNAGAGVVIAAGSPARLIGNRISENGTVAGALHPGIEMQPPLKAVIEHNIVTGNGQRNTELGESNVSQ